MRAKFADRIENVSHFFGGTVGFVAGVRRNAAEGEVDGKFVGIIGQRGVRVGELGRGQTGSGLVRDDVPHDDLERQWAQNLGITRFNRSTAAWPALIERAQMQEPNLLVAGWVADVVDPDNFLRVCIAEQRLRGWQNQDYESLIEQARATLDQQRRLDLYRQADRILIEAAALMPLMYGRSHLLIKPWVKQYAYRPHLTLRWQEVIIEPHP